MLESSPSPFIVLEGIFSPVSSSYAHKQLASDEHRMAMLNKVLRHHRESARQRWNDSDLSCFFVCGDDLVKSFSRILPDGSWLWSQEDVKSIVVDFGIIMNIRTRFALRKSYGSNPIEALRRMGLFLAKCYMVADRACPHQMCSTLLREAVAQGRSIRYCAPDAVVDYINDHCLYTTESVSDQKSSERKEEGT